VTRTCIRSRSLARTLAVSACVGLGLTACGGPSTQPSDGGTTLHDAGSTDGKLDAVSPGTDGTTVGPSGAIAISVGFNSACALLSGGTVECWGDNINGSLGNGTSTSSSAPVAVSGLTGATAVSTTGDTGCALLSGGTVKCWGDNGTGELGDGTTTNSPTPVAVTGLTGVTAFSAGGCALLSGGGMQCWGNNISGQLGIGTMSGPEQCGLAGPCSMTPVTVKGLTDATALSTGDANCAVLSGGTVQCWGDNTYGEVGDGTNTGPESCAPQGPCSTSPVAVTGLTGATAVSGSGGSICALVSGGAVQCWGFNNHGQLGNGTMTNSSTPVMASGLTGATAVSVGGDTACAIVAGGAVMCWGDNQDGELGNGTATDSSTPVVISGLTDATAISFGFDPACAIVSGGAVKCWGDNTYGELGNGTMTNSSTPVEVKLQSNP
jgi:alpha-tubulin suppressor-like RCC1 family protein